MNRVHTGQSEERNAYLIEWQRQFGEQALREQQLLNFDAAGDFQAVARVLAFRKTLITKYAHAIPTAAALKAIASFAPLIEIGAGTGYWASLLREQNVDIVCYDKNPPGNPECENSFHLAASCWTEVLRGDDSQIDHHPDRTLILCWPPPHDEMPARALKRYCGEYFIYIGEMPSNGQDCVYFRNASRPTRKGVTIVPEFFSELHQSWRLVLCEMLPHWEICLDNVYIFQRRVECELH